MQPTYDSYAVVDLPLSRVNDKLTQCPKCSGTSVRVEGDFLRHYREEFQNGESTDIELADRCKLASKVSCHHCKVTFNLVPDQIYDEKQDSMRIRIELAKRDGLLQELDSTKPPIVM